MASAQAKVKYGGSKLSYADFGITSPEEYQAITGGVLLAGAAAIAGGVCVAATAGACLVPLAYVGEDLALSAFLTADAATAFTTGATLGAGTTVAAEMRMAESQTAGTTVPLDWSLVSKAGETRTAHVALHEVANPSKGAHGVFLGDSQGLTNEAWSIAQEQGIRPISEGGVDIYRVPMGRDVGYAGGANADEMSEVPHRTIEIITRGGTNELITAYPVPLG